MPYIDTNDNGPELLAISTLELSVNDDFLSILKGRYFSYSYFSDDNESRRTRQHIAKSSYGLFRYLHRVVIPRPAKA